MKYLIIIISIFTLFFTNDLDWFRKNFQTAHTNKEQALVFYQNTNKITNSDPVFLAYKEAGKMTQSKFEKNRQLKKDLFKEGALALNRLIEQNPNNIEVRFIRLTIQQNTPAILKYNQNIKADKQFVWSNFKHTDSKIQKIIKEYVLSSNKFSEVEKKKL